MPLLKKIRTLAAKVETTIGTAESLSGTDGVFNAFDLMIQPNVPMGEREASGSFNRLSSVPGPRTGTATFKTNVEFNGTDIPQWATTLLPGCGWVNSTGTFTPRSEAPGSNVKTLTIGGYINGVFKSIAGATGTFKFVFPSGRTAYIEWTFTGVWQAVTDTAIISPTYPTDSPLRAGSMTTTFDSVAFCFENLSIDAGNQVVMRECSTSASGYISSMIVDRVPKIMANPESVLVATQDRYGKLLAGTEASLSIAIGSAITFTAPKAQVVNIQEGDRNKFVIDDIEWQCNKNGSTADQELSIAFS